MEKVGIDGVKYSKVKFDDGGWVDAKEYLPANFDLCFLKVKNRTRNISGWSVGKGWDGANLRKKDEVLFWKLNTEEKYATSKR